MNELIRITANEQGSDVVSARELHEFLEVKSKFADWIKNRIIKYGFRENDDYVTLSKNLESGGLEIEYALTLDMAKELSMVERNEKGKQARQYFIEAEKSLRQLTTQPTLLPTDQILLLLSQQTQLLANQQQQSNRHDQLLTQLRADVDAMQSNKRLPEPQPVRSGIDVRKSIVRKVNEYCGIHGYEQRETWTYLYKRMFQVYALDVRRLRRGTESILDAIERYGHLDKLYSLIVAELEYVEE